MIKVVLPHKPDNSKSKHMFLKALRLNGLLSFGTAAQTVELGNLNCTDLRNTRVIYDLKYILSANESDIRL